MIKSIKNKLSNLWTKFVFWFRWHKFSEGEFLWFDITGGYYVYPEGNYWRAKFYSGYTRDWYKPESDFFHSKERAKEVVELWCLRQNKNKVLTLYP